MQTHHSIARLALVLALAVALPATAAEPRDTTRIEIGHDGSSEVVVLDDLAVGESRQLYSEAGTLVTATRTAEAIELDIGGDKTRVHLPAADLSDADIAALVDDAHADGATRVVRVHRKAPGDGTTVDVADAGARVLVIKRDGEALKIDADGADVQVEDLAGGSGKRVIVKRTLAPADAGK